jgi:aspartyl-tRNA(Asn)/glutamyl-tRNA(Gln) amidotransferase subunit A
VAARHRDDLVLRAAHTLYEAGVAATGLTPAGS